MLACPREGLVSAFCSCPPSFASDFLRPHPRGCKFVFYSRVPPNRPLGDFHSRPSAMSSVPKIGRGENAAPSEIPDPLGYRWSVGSGIGERHRELDGLTAARDFEEGRGVLPVAVQQSRVRKTVPLNPGCFLFPCPQRSFTVLQGENPFRPCEKSPIFSSYAFLP